MSLLHGTPLVWAGPVSNWIEACRRIEAMDVETVVPGHGPITDRHGAAAVAEYFEYVSAESRKRLVTWLNLLDRRIAFTQDREACDARGDFHRTRHR